MIVQPIYLKRYDWTLEFYYVEKEYPIDIILDELQSINCKYIEDIKDLMETEPLDSGFTYTTYKYSMVVIGPTTSKEQFINTLDHEKGHAVMHICQYYDIDPYGEEIQYLTGYLSEQTFKVARQFLCDEESCNN